jgi:hypothetical protein
MPIATRFLALTGLAAALVWASGPSALAQTRTPLPPEKPSHQTVPEAQGSGGSSEALSDKLDRQHGVIIPPADIDPGLSKSPPRSAGDSTPVVPPPGTPGGKPGANPK